MFVVIIPPILPIGQVFFLGQGREGVEVLSPLIIPRLDTAC